MSAWNVEDVQKIVQLEQLRCVPVLVVQLLLFQVNLANPARVPVDNFLDSISFVSKWKI
jgi:hypothetical protein